MKKEEGKYSTNKIVETSTEKKSPRESVMMSLDDRNNEIKIND